MPTRETIGVFVAISLGALLFLGLKVGNLASFSVAETHLVKANFDNIGGLKKWTPAKEFSEASTQPVAASPEAAGVTGSAYEPKIPYIHDTLLTATAVRTGIVQTKLRP